MKWLRQVRLAVVWYTAASLAVPACSTGDKGVRVKGRVLENGQPIKFLPSEDMMVGFSQEAPPGQTPVGASGSVKPQDGTFVITGPSGRGLPPGRYRISVFSQIYGGSDRNRFEALFGSKKPPLYAEVNSDRGQTFTIDLGAWSVTKQ